YVGTAYTYQLSAVGGRPPYSWQLAGGSLPGGLNITGSSLSGSPTTAGNFSFTVQVTDANMQTQTKMISLAVLRSPSISGTAPDGYVAVAYNATPMVVDGRAPFNW